MSLIDKLRAARDTPSTALHEFLSKYNPTLKRIHIFVEGSEDKIFYGFHFQQFVPSSYEILTYACGNKDGVYSVHATVRAGQLTAKDVYWCVDKDLSDFIPESRAEDPQMFVTDTYSIENYFVTEQAISHSVTHLFKVRGVSLSVDSIMDRYRSSLTRFYSCFTPIMALILCTRRRGGRPNLRNLSVNHLVEFDPKLAPRPLRKRCQYLQTNTGSLLPRWQEIGVVTRELQRSEPKCYIRGKWELWFIVNFLKQLRIALHVEALQNRGEVNWLVPLELSNIIAVLTPVVKIPVTLSAFLNRHFPQQGIL